MTHRHYSLPIIIIVGIYFCFLSSAPQISAQPRITNTPVPVVIPDASATPLPQVDNNTFEASPSPTFTPTQPLPNATIVSIAASGTALIRDFPEDGAVIGVLADNTDYQVLGQYFSWYQIQLPDFPQNPAWVYFEDILISGNLDEVPFVDPSVQPVALSVQDIATLTVQALLLTPEFAQTATAESRVLEIPQNEAGEAIAGPTSEFAPTYTRPAEVVVLRATPEPNALIIEVPELDIIDSTIQSVSAGDIPPALTILALLVFGGLGLIIASFRN